MKPETKELSSLVGLSLASRGISTTTFDEIHEALTWVLGWDVFTHELAEIGPWAKAAERVRMADIKLAEWADDLTAFQPTIQANQDAWEPFKERFLREYGETCLLPKGDGERTESPIKSMRRIAPGKPLIVVMPGE